LGRLIRALDAEGGVDAGPRVAIVDGMVGAGKTRLVVHAAHALAATSRFDRVLWVDLRGFDPEHPPADPSAVLDGFLRSLGVPGSRIAGLGLHRRIRLFRERLASQRVLIGLDDAASEEQVAPLLPTVG